jgi:hypothetical protein
MSSQITSTPYVGAVPTQIPGLSLWLDPTDLTKISLSNGNVISITDKASAQVFSGGVPPRYTSNIQNGQPVINFTGSNYLSNTTYVFPNLNYTIFSIQNLQSTVGNVLGYQRVITANAGVSTNNFIFMGAQGINVAGFTAFNSTNWNDTNAISPNVNNSNVWRIASFTVDSTLATSNNLLPYIDGISKTVKVGATGAFTGLLFGGLISGGSSNQSWNGYVGDILIYNQVLTTAQRQQVEGYLAYKWGLQSSLTTTHPYFNNPLLPNVTIAPNINENIFQPTTLPGCVLWLDANDTSRMTLVGNNITQYIDKSTNAIILSNATSSNQPTLVLDSNNMPNMLFNGTSQFLVNSAVAASNLTLNNEVSIFFVHTPSNATNCLITWSDFSISGGTPRITFVTPEGSTGFKFDYSSYISGRVETVVANYLTSGRRLEGGYKRGTNQVIRTFGSNRASIVNALTITGSTSLPLALGWFFNLAGYYYGGRFCELVWYNRGLGDSEIEQVESYLAWKWGTQASLPITHPYYYNRIAPIPIAIPTPICLTQSPYWSPLTYSGLALWLDAADATTIQFSSGANISNWLDKSGNGRNATQATQSNQPIYTNNGAVFTATNSTFLNISVPFSTSHSVFLVAQSTTGNQNYYYSRSVTGAGPTIIQYFTGTSIEYFDIGERATFVTTPPTTSPFIVNFVRSFGSTVTGFYNGISAFSISQTYSSNTAQPWIYIGRSDLTNYLNATIYEFLIFSNVLTSQQRQNVEGYLAWKWGLTRSLPGTHQNAYIPP